MERLDLRIKSSQAKSIGTVALITGGLIITLYKGMPITSSPQSNKLLNKQLLLHPSNRWAIGGFFLASHSFILALMYIIQVQLTQISRINLNVLL